MPASPVDLLHPDPGVGICGFARRDEAGARHFAVQEEVTGFATPPGVGFELARDSGNGRGFVLILETQHKVDETGGDDAKNDVGGGTFRWSHPGK